MHDNLDPPSHPSQAAVCVMEFTGRDAWDRMGLWECSP
jgi:hypothetical protein